ncbi:glycosyltransferase [Sphingobacterium hotanense]|uniref:Glycosyltransferase n=1 Tax=Sphingobacterium hotanense TaxID=649196 RepID=A0ABT7NL60_9SPHI|nr:glycosyltransferase [Sphingobacterium hotanense]MDM1047940.1 glycosyltransferase [Sphingobacterium hotanense]
MRLFFVTDARFFQTPDTKIYAGEFSFSNILWNRYIPEFEEVYVVGRVFQVKDFENSAHIVSNVTVLPVPSFDSPLSFLKSRNKIKTIIRDYFQNYSPNAVIIRGAWSLGFEVAKFCIEKNIPYGIEVIGDPHDVFAKGVIKHPLRPLLKYLFTKFQKKAVYHASSVIYVTRETLQRRYPSNKRAFTTHASDVIINEFLTEIKTYPYQKSIKLISVGSLEQMYKAPDIVLHAVKKLISQGVDVQLDWLGHGKFMDEMINLANVLGISNNVRFVGSVSSNDVVHYLDNSDVFLLVSRTEGLPRALIEAMARALPSIGTRVGGIPELIHPDLLIEVEDVEALVDRIKLVISSKHNYSRFSEYSISTASDFDPSELSERRNLFFKSLKK